jgi:hypothetical protein
MSDDEDNLKELKDYLHREIKRGRKTYTPDIYAKILKHFVTLIDKTDMEQQKLCAKALYQDMYHKVVDLRFDPDKMEDELKEELQDYVKPKNPDDPEAGTYLDIMYMGKFIDPICLDVGNRLVEKLSGLAALAEQALKKKERLTICSQDISKLVRDSLGEVGVQIVEQDYLQEMQSDYRL